MQDPIQETNYMINSLANRREDLFPGVVIAYKQEVNKFYFYCDNDVILIVHVLTDRIIRFRYSSDGNFPPDFSYAIDPDFKPEVPGAKLKDNPDHFRITTRQVVCTLQKDGLQVKIMDKAGDVILEDEKGYHWEYDLQTGNNIVKMSKRV